MLGGGSRNVSDEERKAWRDYFKQQIIKFSKNGWDPNISYVTVANNPMVINDGTHRIAWVYCNSPNFYIPVQFTMRKPWFPLDGIDYWAKKGLTSEEIDMITKRYYQMLNKMKTEITGFIISDYLSENILNKMEEYGDLHIIRQIDAADLSLLDNSAYKVFVRYAKKTAKISTNWTFFGINIKYRDLQYKNYRIYSACIERLKKDLKSLLNQDKYGYITSSVTEAIELESFFEEVSQKQKRLMEGNQ